MFCYNKSRVNGSSLNLSLSLFFMKREFALILSIALKIACTSLGGAQGSHFFGLLIKSPKYNKFPEVYSSPDVVQTILN